MFLDNIGQNSSCAHVRLCLQYASDADMAQLVEHHLAKVRVAGSNPVVRSIDYSSRQNYFAGFI